MTIKTQLQTNNAELQAHLQDILALPNIDDVKNGQYVWKRYEFVDVNISMQLKTASATPVISVDSTDIDLTTVDSDFLVGFKTTYHYQGADVPIEFRDGYAILNNEEATQYPYVFSPSAKTITMQKWNLTGISLTFATAQHRGKVQKDFSVSNNESEYPNDGEKDGYWYKLYKLTESSMDINLLGFTRYEVYEAISSSNGSSLTMNHAFGSTPTMVYVYAVNPDSHSEQFARAITGVSMNSIGCEINGSNGQYVSKSASIESSSTKITISTTYSYGIRAGVTYRAVLFA